MIWYQLNMYSKNYVYAAEQHVHVFEESFHLDFTKVTLRKSFLGYNKEVPFGLSLCRPY